MSIVAPSQKRLVWPVAIALTATMVTALLLYLPTRTPSVPTSESPSLAAPGVTQATWEIKGFPAGGAGVRPLTKADRAKIAAQRPPLAALISDVYDAMFLEPDRLPSVLKARFARPAARRAARAGLGIPAKTTEVRTLQRKARIGIHMQGADRAAAEVVVAGAAVVKGTKNRFRHEATLWLERTRRTWKIIAFDVMQGPAR